MILDLIEKQMFFGYLGNIKGLLSLGVVWEVGV